MGSKSEGSWGARLRTERARTFVGREDALEAGLALLEHPTRRLLHVHGPAGMGKSTVGRALAARARESGHAVRLVDALDARGSLASLSDALAGPWDLLILDSLGALGALESWLRESFLPSLPDHARVVTLGRRPLSPPWVNDRAGRALATQHRLEPLSEAACRTYLARQEVDEALHEQIVEASAGWPLALALLAQSTAGLEELRESQVAGVLTRLADALVREAPTPDHARALHAAALVQRLTAPLLAAMLEREDVTEIFDWLAGRAFAMPSPRGLRLHAVLADALHGHLGSRAPERMVALRDRAIDAYAERLAPIGARDTSGPARAGELIYDALYTLRDSPVVQRFGVGSHPSAYPDALRPSDRPPLLDAIERHEGAEARAIAERWLDDARSEVIVYRGQDGAPQAFALFGSFRREEATTRSEADPVLADLLRALDERAPLRRGERLLLCRWWLSLEHGQRSDQALGQLIALLSQRLAFSPGVTVGAAVHHEPERWAKRPEITHELLSRSALGGVELGVFGHDWRVEPPSLWFRRFLRGLAGDVTAPPVHPAAVAILDREAFDAAARKALKRLRQPERLKRSPLAQAPLVVRQGARPGTLEAGERLRATLERAMDALAGPEGHRELLRRTYVEEAAKQLAVADDLGMAFSTYRRHLATATERLLERLWAWELGGTLD